MNIRHKQRATGLVAKQFNAVSCHIQLDKSDVAFMFGCNQVEGNHYV